ncbi:hypothetical protein AWN74_08095 [Acinetobacter baumannii]|nr:hypothetical protein AWN74_08095 [Acinetobacter baumannii]
MVKADAQAKRYQYGHLKNHHGAALWQINAFAHWSGHVHLVSVQVAKRFPVTQFQENLYLKHRVHLQCFLKKQHAVQETYGGKS